MRRSAFGFTFLAFATIALSPAVAQNQTQAQTSTLPKSELQVLDDALPGALINNPLKMDWTLYGQGGQIRPVRAQGLPGSAAMRVEIPRAGATTYEVGFNVPLTANVRSGEHITIAFWARTVRASTPDKNGVLGLRIQSNGPPYPGFGDTRLAIRTAWKLHEVKLVANQNIAADLAVLGFQVSGARQTLEFGQVYVLDMEVP